MKYLRFRLLRFEPISMIPGLQENSPQHTARNKSQRALWETTGILLFIIVLFFSFWTGYRGIDFGHHWDEPKLIISVAHVVESELFSLDGIITLRFPLYWLRPPWW